VLHWKEAPSKNLSFPKEASLADQILWLVSIISIKTNEFCLLTSLVCQDNLNCVMTHLNDSHISFKREETSRTMKQRLASSIQWWDPSGEIVRCLIIQARNPDCKRSNNSKSREAKRRKTLLLINYSRSNWDWILRKRQTSTTKWLPTHTEGGL